jgi:hypothetical protein
VTRMGAIDHVVGRITHHGMRASLPQGGTSRPMLPCGGAFPR